MKYFILMVLVLSVIGANAQTNGDTISIADANQAEYVRKEHRVGITKYEKHKFQLRDGRKVWIQLNQNGKPKIKKARITNIQDHEITFKPTDKNFDEVTLTDSTLTFIGFTSTGRIILATTANILIVSTAIAASVIMVGIIVIQAVLIPIILITSKGDLEIVSFKWAGEAFKDIGELIEMTMPFKKKIDLKDQKWKLRAAEVTHTP